MKARDGPIINGALHAFVPNGGGRLGCRLGRRAGLNFGDVSPGSYWFTMAPLDDVPIFLYPRGGRGAGGRNGGVQIEAIKGERISGG